MLIELNRPYPRMEDRGKNAIVTRALAVGLLVAREGYLPGDSGSKPSGYGRFDASCRRRRLAERLGDVVRE